MPSTLALLIFCNINLYQIISTVGPRVCPGKGYRREKEGSESLCEFSPTLVDFNRPHTMRKCALTYGLCVIEIGFKIDSVKMVKGWEKWANGRICPTSNKSQSHWSNLDGDLNKPPNNSFWWTLHCLKRSSLFSRPILKNWIFCWDHFGWVWGYFWFFNCFTFWSLQ